MVFYGHYCINVFNYSFFLLKLGKIYIMPKSKQIFLTYIIDNYEADWFQYQVENSTEKVIDIYLANSGGSVNAGLRIAAFIQAVNAKGDKEINTYNLSNADSIATAIFLAPPPEQRHVLEHSTMFIHEPRLMMDFDITEGKSKKTTEALAMQKNRLADFYIKNIEGLSKDEAISLMEGEIDLTAAMMKEKNIVHEIMDNFEIAALRETTTKFYNKMGIFNKKEPVNTIVLSDNVTNLVFSGELKEGTEVQKIGEIIDLKGEHITNDNRKIIVDENNKVVSLEQLESNNSNEFDPEAFKAEITNEVAEAIALAMKPVNEALRGMKAGSHTPPKDDNINNQANNNVSAQSTARKTVAEVMKERVDVSKARGV